MIRSFTIITTVPNDLCGELHNRMPVILPPETWSMWLGESEPVEADQLKSLLVPYTGKMVAWPVSQRVGNVKNNDASLIEPIM
jgi:putative SOS response-associated peptidase YedK